MQNMRKYLCKFLHKYFLRHFKISSKTTNFEKNITASTKIMYLLKISICPFCQEVNIQRMVDAINVWITPPFGPITIRRVYFCIYRLTEYVEMIEMLKTIFFGNKVLRIPEKDSSYRVR